MGISEREIDELEALLDEFDRSVEASGAELWVPLASSLDGFLTALVVSTEQVPQAEWLDSVFPEVRRHLPDQSAERLVALTLARKLEIAETLMRGRLEFQPIYEVDARHDEVLWAIWIEGFDRAMQLRHPSWVALFTHDDHLLAAAFREMSMYVGVSRGFKLSKKEQKEVDRDAPGLIPFFAELLYCRQRGLPTLALDPPAPEQPLRTAKVGRNEPCPCGSGRKYKKCCGSLA